MSTLDQKLNRIGRITDVFSSIILSALLLNMWVLNATAVEQTSKAPEQQPNAFLMPEEVESSRIQRFLDTVLQTSTATAAIPAAEFADDLTPSKFGKPVAYVNIDQLYLISKTGRIISAADSSERYDLPIISSNSFMVDAEGKRLLDDGTKNALGLLAEIQKRYVLEAILSEIKIKDNNIIAYMNLGKVMPVIFGQGAWEQKINTFIAYQKQLGASELTRHALYLDLRIENRIVAKKNV